MSEVILNKLRDVEVAARRLAKGQGEDAELTLPMDDGIKIVCVARVVSRWRRLSGVESTWIIQGPKGNQGLFSGYSVKEVARLMKLFLNEVSK